MRDYVYVEDVAKLNADSIENKAEGVFNLGTGKPRSLLEVVGSLNRILGSNIEPDISQDFRPGDNRHDYADLSKLRIAFDARTFTELDAGLEKLVRWQKLCVQLIHSKRKRKRD